MRTLLPCVLLLSACATQLDESSTAQDLTRKCPIDDPDCGAPEPTDPPPTGGGGKGGGDPLPPSSEDPACQALVTGWIHSNPDYASTTGVPMGTTITVAWDVQLPTTCEASGPVLLGGVEVPLQGSKTVTMVASGVFRLTVGSRQVAALSVKTILPSVVHITANTTEQGALFAQAAGTPGTTVLLKDGLELDLSGWALTTIWVAQGVTIAGEAAPAGGVIYNVQQQTQSLDLQTQGNTELYRVARDSRHLGPKLFTRTRSPNGLLDLRGDNIKLRGFRLFGPDLGMTDGEGKGIVSTSNVGIELDRLEVAGFAIAGVYLQDTDCNEGDTRCPRHNDAFNDINIHDCFFHHNQHAPGGNGYGVSVTHGAKARIRHNVFDFNRHAIMSGGEAGTGYWADENLILRGGGHSEGFGGFSWHTHIFDVHGSENCGIVSWVDDSQWNCGRAGELYYIQRNAFQYIAGPAFKLRGTPTNGAFVTDNVFGHPYGTTVLDHTEYGLVESDNTYFKDTFGQYGVCDFDADGKDDLFLATGRSWWFSSAGTFHWTYLNNAREELSQVGLGDFDHDGRCDVLAVNSETQRWELSSGGTGAFAPLPTGFVGPLSQLRFGDFNGDGYTDIFQRWSDGQWFAYLAPMSQGPVPLGSSGFPIEALRLGDFDGDHITDVFAIAAGGNWAWSRSGLDSWRPLNTRYHTLDGILMIANVDGIPGDDVIRMISTSQTGGQLQISSGGSGPWTNLAPVSWSTHVEYDGNHYTTIPDYALWFAGTFTSPLGDSVLQLDLKDRSLSQFSAGQSSFAPYSMYAK